MGRSIFTFSTKYALRFSQPLSILTIPGRHPLPARSAGGIFSQQNGPGDEISVTGRHLSIAGARRGCYAETGEISLGGASDEKA
jgi:hypothetical protein